MSGPTPKMRTKARRRYPDGPFQFGLQFAALFTELTVAAAKRAEGVLGRRCGIFQSAWTEALTPRSQSSGGETVERFAELGRGRDYQSLHLVGGLRASLDSRVLGALQHADHLDFALA